MCLDTLSARLAAYDHLEPAQTAKLQTTNSSRAGAFSKRSKNF